MKQLSEYINEKLVLNKDTFKNNYKYFPKTKEELKNIINKLIEERKDKDVIDLNDIDTSKITDMSELFENMDITKIDISKWNVSNITTMEYMFYGCINLESIGNISDWDVSEVKTMSYMFYCCDNLKDIGDLSNWKISKVENMHAMFYWCENIKSIGDLSKWNVSNVIDMRNMFFGSNIKNIPSWYKE